MVKNGRFSHCTLESKTYEIQLVPGLNALHLCTPEPSYIIYMEEIARKKPHFQEMRREREMKSEMRSESANFLRFCKAYSEAFVSKGTTENSE